MIIETIFVNGENECYNDVIDYDFYPETKMMFINRKYNVSTYVQFTENVKAVHICNGTERGYLEGHDETC